MNLNPNNPEDVKQFIEEIGEHYVDGDSNVYTFEAYDHEASRPCIITYYANPKPIKLSMTMHLNDEEKPRVAAFNEEGERIEDKVDPY
jgi:hypothetical protein